MKPVDRILTGLPAIPAAVGEARRWPTATSVQLARKVYRAVFWFAVAVTAAFLLLGVPSLLLVPPAAVALICLAGWAATVSFAAGYQDGVRHAIEDTTRLAQHAAVLPDEIERELWTAFLSPETGEGYLYVLEFETGTIKIGQTKDAARRVNEHRRDAWAYNVVVTNAWISKPHKGYLTNEVKLMSAVTEMGGERAKREYFHGVSFERVVEVGCELASRPTLARRRRPATAPSSQPAPQPDPA